MDVQRLKDSFARVAMHGDAVPLFFYSDLFLRHPETRELFPVSMQVVRDRLVAALARAVSGVDDMADLQPFLQDLGRDHRKFGVVAEHFAAVGTSLLATLAHFDGPAWTPELAADWQSAYQIVSGVMIDAAREDSLVRPPFWDANVIAHELRRFDIAAFRVLPSQPLEYLPGQSVGMESAARPRVWRFYSMANAPREDNTLDFHVRMLDGGDLSTVLTRGLDVGTRLRLGAPIGKLKLDSTTGRDVLLVAGSTGLAPLKAILEQIAALREPPRVHLFFGAQTVDGLYDLPELEKFEVGCPWLTVTPAVWGEAYHQGSQGRIEDVMAASGTWRGHDAYVAGPTSMVEATVGRLTALGVPQDQIHTEDFGWSES